MSQMVNTAPTVSMNRPGWLPADAWTIARRDLLHWRQQTGAVLVGWFFPIMIVLMFGALFGGAIATPEGSTYIEFLMPGMFTLTMFFGIEATMTAVTTDASRGVTDRFRSMPMHSAAVVLGRCIADMLNSMVGLGIMIAAGLLLGWRWHGSFGAALAAVGLLLLLRFALLWVGIYIGVSAKGAESLTAVQILIWPVGFLSNVFVDPTTMPAWLGTIASWNPLSVTSAAIRELFMNPVVPTNSWIATHAVLMAVVLPLLLVAIFLPLSARKYRRLSR